MRLKIVVHTEDIITACVFHSGENRIVLTAVFGKVYTDYKAVFSGKLFNFIISSVIRAVVHQNKFIVAVFLKFFRRFFNNARN